MKNFAKTWVIIGFILIQSCSSVKKSDFLILKNNFKVYDIEIFENQAKYAEFSKKSDLGKTRKNTMVLLFFKRNGDFYSISEFNSLKGAKDDKSVIVSFDDYKEYIKKYAHRGKAFSEKIPFARLEYSFLLGDKTQKIYIFDAFQIKYTPSKEMDE